MKGHCAQKANVGRQETPLFSFSWGYACWVTQHFYTSVNDHGSTVGTRFRITTTFQRAGEFLIKEVEVVRTTYIAIPFWSMCSAGQRLLSRVHPGLCGLHGTRDQVNGVLPRVVLSGNRQSRL